MRILSSCTAALLFAAACQSPELVEAPRGERAMWVGEAIREVSVKGAVIAERTLYEHHFEQGSPALSEIGSRDVAILAEHFAEHPGALVVHRGRTDEDLHGRRVAAVKERLVHLGLDLAEARIAEGLPGGDGMPAEQVNTILTEPEAGADPSMILGG